jgi:hypothetical protein
MISNRSAAKSGSPAVPGFQLSAETFESFYHTVSGLKFPLDVAQVLELRSVINQAVDSFPEPVSTPAYREFCDALQTVINAIGIENKAHSERMMRILIMIRDLHYTYTINTRDQENRLQHEIATKREQRTLSRRYGWVYSVGTVGAAAIWFGLAEAAWTVQLLTLGLAVGAWAHWHAVPAIDNRIALLERQAQQLQQARVKSIHWRLLVQKLALILGFKRDNRVEVFRLDPEAAEVDRTRRPSRH